MRTVINYLDAQQRAEKSKTASHECTKAIGYFIEESQNCFNSRATSSTENEEFLSVFCEARNNREGFFTNSQRLNDFSKTIRSKQYLAIGKLNGEDINPSLRRLEKQHNIDFSSMKPRTWFYEGKIFISPEFKQSGKSFIINRTIKQEWLDSLPKEKVLSLKDKIKNWFSPLSVPNKTKPLSPENLENNSNSFFEELDEQEKESENSDLEEIEAEWL